MNDKSIFCDCSRDCDQHILNADSDYLVLQCGSHRMLLCISSKVEKTAVKCKSIRSSRSFYAECFPQRN